ncbi:MAG TPA: 2-oxoacid:ferredoxin oxidoreductase subunit beta [Thermopetrobacter sp.]|nr:2-oxoacid:ferredoxin oxidoreductase subunit beta [Thermopetrobacter sp.]
MNERLDHDGLPRDGSFEIRDWLRLRLMPHFMCPGCGHGIALRALLWALDELEVNRDDLAVVSGIGCSGRTAAYIDANTFHVTHGRPLAFATGLKLARPDLTVVVISGDGDSLAIGGNHFLHACRRNLDMTLILLNNEIYGMTGGQVSPTTTTDRFTTTTPFGNNEPVFDACEVARAAGATFVGREATLQTPNLKELLKEAVAHHGFSMVEVISDCTEIYGRKNDLGNSPEMILAQKSGMRPEVYRDTVDRPFRPNPFRTGVLARAERPEYLDALLARRRALRDGTGGGR